MAKERDITAVEPKGTQYTLTYWGYKRNYKTIEGLRHDYERLDHHSRQDAKAYDRDGNHIAIYSEQGEE